MSKSDKIQEDLARAARRAMRLAERARNTANRKAKRASEAAVRAEELAKRASRKSKRRARERQMERSIEDLVDDVAEKWSHKAEDWIDKAKEQWLGEDDLYRDSFFADDELDDQDIDDDGLNSSTTREEVARKRSRRNGSRGRHRKRSARARVWSFRHRLRNGRSLYRDPEAGKICGVCAGFAEYYGVETWQVRLGALLGLIFVPSLAVTGYFIAYFLMDKKPYYLRMTDQYYEQDLFTSRNESGELTGAKETSSTHSRRGRKQRAGSNLRTSNTRSVRIAKSKFVDLENRLRSMESHVTDSTFELRRELGKMSAED